MKKIISLAAVGVAAALVTGCGGSATSGTPGAAAGTSPSATTSPANGARVLPVATNPIVNSATAPGLTITKALVENNVSAETGKAVADHLEIVLANTTTKPIKRIAAYYTITDPSSGASEGYYTELTGVGLEPGASHVVHFDDTAAVDHFPVNKYSLYYTDKNALVVDVFASAPGLKVATFTVNKDAAGAEAGVE